MSKVRKFDWGAKRVPLSPERAPASHAVAFADAERGRTVNVQDRARQPRSEPQGASR
jgi:hypothetical protein